MKIFFVNNCEIELNNENLVFCQKLNRNPEVIFWKILNGTLSEKIEALKQTKENEKIRNLQRNDPEIQ